MSEEGHCWCEKLSHVASSIDRPADGLLPCEMRFRRIFGAFWQVFAIFLRLMDDLEAGRRYYFQLVSNGPALLAKFRVFGD